MKNYLLGLMISLVSVAVMGAECSPDMLGAKYEMTQSETRTSSHAVQSFELWRKQGLVAHIYPKKAVSEIWNQVKGGRVRLVRNFDHDQRAIEYAPIDLNGGKGDRNWHEKYQLISDQLLLSMKKKNESGYGCQHQIEYFRESQGELLSIIWLPELKLVKSFEQQSNGQHINWRLLDTVYDKKEITDQFTRRSEYISTDYADVGDNETDPFLRKMINLGFIRHGSSGFYDADGHVLESDHHHH